MPIYEFNCPKCKINFEELIFGGDIPPCPACGSQNTKKLISRATFHSQSGSGDDQPANFPSPPSSSGCGGCSGGNCSACGM